MTPKHNKDDVMRAGRILNFLANYGLNGSSAEENMETESNSRTLCFWFAGYVQDQVEEKRQEDISKTWYRPSGGQLENLTGSKIEFGERMLDFL
ncbi:hypothetical protein RUND412_003865 [Rhizina undulata]